MRRDEERQRGGAGGTGEHQSRTGDRYTDEDSGDFGRCDCSVETNVTREGKGTDYDEMPLRTRGVENTALIKVTPHRGPVMHSRFQP